jgi:hypothetical protein
VSLLNTQIINTAPYHKPEMQIQNNGYEDEKISTFHVNARFPQMANASLTWKRKSSARGVRRRLRKAEYSDRAFWPPFGSPNELSFRHDSAGSSLNLGIGGVVLDPELRSFRHVSYEQFPEKEDSCGCLLMK